MKQWVRLVYGDIRAGEPVPFDVFDSRGRKVLIKGMRWASEGHLRLVLAAGLYRVLTQVGLGPGMS